MTTGVFNTERKSPSDYWGICLICPAGLFPRVGRYPLVCVEELFFAYLRLRVEGESVMARQWDFARENMLQTWTLQTIYNSKEKIVWMKRNQDNQFSDAITFSTNLWNDAYSIAGNILFIFDQ